MSKKGYTDTELLDFLQTINDRFSGKCEVMVDNNWFRWALRESYDATAPQDVRRAIVEFIEGVGNENQKT
jgi:hypothetical protein